MFGGRTSFGAGMLDRVVDGYQKGLLAMSLARSVMISIIIHYSTGLYAPPNVSRRYM